MLNSLYKKFTRKLLGNENIRETFELLWLLNFLKK